MSQELLAYRFENRREVADAVATLVESDHVDDLVVYVGQEEVFVTVKTAGQDENEREWVRGVLCLGSDVTDKSGWGLLETLGDTGQKLGVVEVYRTKQGAKRFRGYSYRRKLRRKRGGAPIRGSASIRPLTT